MGPHRPSNERGARWALLRAQPEVVAGHGCALSDEKIPVALQCEFPQPKIRNRILQQASSAKLGIEVNAHQDTDFGVGSELVDFKIQFLLCRRECRFIHAAHSDWRLRLASI